MRNCNMLKTVREKKLLSQEKMATKIGVSYSYYVKVESGRVQASRNFMQKFKNAFPSENIDFIFFQTNSNKCAV